MLHEEVPQRSIKSMLNVGCGMLQDHEDRQESRWQDVITPPPPPPPKPEPPPHPPTPQHPQTKRSIKNVLDVARRSATA